MNDKLNLDLRGLASFAEFSKLLLNGTYVGVKVHDVQLVKEIQAEVLTESMIAHEDLHCSVIYSKGRGKLPRLDPARSYSGTIAGFKLFGPNSDCLVLDVDSPELQELHEELKDQGLTHTWPEYSPHVTLTYQYSGGLPDCSKWIGQRIQFCDPYFQAIDEEY